VLVVVVLVQVRVALAQADVLVIRVGGLEADSDHELVVARREILGQRSNSLNSLVVGRGVPVVVRAILGNHEVRSSLHRIELFRDPFIPSWHRQGQVYC